MVRRSIALTAVLAASLAAAGELAPVTVKLPSGTALRGELAQDDDDRARGLMFRTEEQFQPDQAMVFLFETMELQSFWMKNMNFAIDIVWLSPEMKIVHVERDVPPCTKEERDCPLYTPVQKAQLVVELYRGTYAKEKLKVGDAIEVRTPDGKPLAVPGKDP
ncbi:MAG: DUF192 domain-containing protein [Acidobacteriota bacterium]